MTTSTRISVLGAILFGAIATASCAPGGMRVHVASATVADLQAAAEADTVWYEFRTGDEVPFQFLVFGDAASTGAPTTLVARRDFWIILSEGKQLQISYNGKTASTDEMEFILSVIPGEDGRAKVVWLNHMGTGDPAKALQEIIGPAQ